MIVFGHSLGGAIAIYFTARYVSQIEALVLSAPAYLPGGSIPALKIAIGRLVNKVAPHTRLPKSTKPELISRDPVQVEAYVNDPLSFHFNTVRQGAEILDAMAKVPEQLPKLQLPVVLFHGSCDQIVRAEGSFDILRGLPGPDRTLHILPGGYHEPHNDIDKENYFLLLNQWLSDHVSADKKPRQTKESMVRTPSLEKKPSRKSHREKES